MTPKERLAQLNQAIEAIRSGWPFLMAHLDERERVLTHLLVNENNEQTRGRIKQIRELKELPESLISERDGIQTGISESDPAD